MRHRFLLLCVLTLSGALRSSAEEVKAGGATFEIVFPSEASPTLRAVALRWISRAGTAVGGYYGGIPVARATIRLSLRGSREPGGGQAFGWNGPEIKMALGRDATDQDLADDWMMTHEMLHLCFPSLADRHHWLEEGLATYLEPIARVRAGQLRAEAMWADVVRDLPQGEPAPGDRGLDHTHTWGRTYWGGALFCLQADVEIRRRTENRLGLEDALQAIAKAGGVITAEWPIERALAVGDAATGASVLRELYAQMKDQPVTVDLATRWRDLGIMPSGRGVHLVETAPLAAVRRAITTPRTNLAASH